MHLAKVLSYILIPLCLQCFLMTVHYSSLGQDAPERPIKITRRPFRFHNRAKNVKHLIHKVQSNL